VKKKVKKGVVSKKSKYHDRIVRGLKDVEAGRLTKLEKYPELTVCEKLLFSSLLMKHMCYLNMECTDVFAVLARLKMQLELVTAGTEKDGYKINLED